MGNVRFKIQNLVIQNNVTSDKDRWMSYRGDRFKYNKLQSANTLDAGNDSTIVYEFTRTGGFDLVNPDDKCEMKQLIEQIQVF